MKLHSVKSLNQDDIHPFLVKGGKNTEVIDQKKRRSDYIVQKKQPNFEDKWTCGPLIGQGGMGKIFFVHLEKKETNSVGFKKIQIKKASKLVMHEDDPQRCVKIMNTSPRSIMKKLVHDSIGAHENVIQMLEFYQSQGLSKFVLQFIPGKTLHDHLLNHQRLPLKQILQQIASGLAHIHGRGIVHRDIKLDNIMMDQNHHIKIIDFSLAAFYKINGQLCTFCGSIPFCSPEVIKRIPYIGPEIDVWSFGIVMYALATGRLPFEGNDTIIIPQIMWDAPKFHLVEDLHLRSLIIKMLEKKSKQRCTITDVLSHPYFKKEDMVSDGLNLRSHSDNVLCGKHHSDDVKIFKKHKLWSIQEVDEEDENC